MEKLKRREQLMLYAPLIIWIGVIFLLSSGQGSMKQTSLIIRPLLEFFFPSASPETLLLYHGVIRKFAHFAEYAVLGLLACRTFARSNHAFLRDHFYLAAGVLIIVIAGLDELNQSFNSARTGAILDVAIDVSGGAIAILAYWLMRKRRHHSPPV